MRIGPGLAMQVWMSILVALIHSAHRGGVAELAFFAAAQAMFLAAGAMEAGADETGSRSRALGPTRIASVALFVAYAVVSLRPS